MRASTDRILTTHVGSLPRSERLLGMIGDIEAGGFSRQRGGGGFEFVVQAGEIKFLHHGAHDLGGGGFFRMGMESDHEFGGS